MPPKSHLFSTIVLLVVPSPIIAKSWLDIIQEYTNSTCDNDVAAPVVPPSGIFQFDDDLWDTTTKDEVSLEAVQQVMGCPKADKYGTFDDNPYGYSRVPTEENEWRHMYEAYHAVVPPEEASIPRHYDHSSFAQPVEIHVAAFVGRGIRATTFIPEGTLVWRPSNAAEFKRVEDLRRFLEHIMTHSTKEVACDTVRWLYSSKASAKENDYIICVDMDEGSLINMASTDEELNVAQTLERIDDADRRVYGCQTGSLYATRDIQPGEEIRMDYSDFAEGDGFWELGIDPTGL